MQYQEVDTFKGERQMCRECLRDAVSEAAVIKIPWIIGVTGVSGKCVEDFDVLSEARQETYLKFHPVVSEFPEMDQNALTNYPFSDALFQRAIERCAAKIRSDSSLAQSRQKSENAQNLEALPDSIVASEIDDKYTKVLEVIADRLRPNLISWMSRSNEKKNSSKDEKQKKLKDYTEAMLDAAIRKKIEDYARLHREFPTIYAKHQGKVPREPKTPAVMAYLASSIERFAWEEICTNRMVLPGDDFDVADESGGDEKWRDEEESGGHTDKTFAIPAKNLKGNKIKVILIRLVHYATGKPIKELAAEFGLDVNKINVAWHRLTDELAEIATKISLHDLLDTADSTHDRKTLMRAFLRTFWDAGDMREVFETFPEQYRVIINKFISGE